MKDSCSTAVQRIREVRKDSGDSALDDDTIDVASSFDGSWSSRGHSARDCIVAAVAEETRQVIDAIFLSKGCPQCTALESAREAGRISTTEFMTKMASHEEVCLLNHDGSSQVEIFEFFTGSKILILTV